jgi:uracil-DNA glycosylase
MKMCEHNNIHESWNELFDQYLIDLDTLYDDNGVDQYKVYPPRYQIFRVFQMDVKDIRVVFLGQDPYHNPDQANGLSFSVSKGIAIPPSLKNIYTELQNEFPDRNYVYTHGDLSRLFDEEKIFLLNASLSVYKNKPESHMDVWSEFTNDVIRYIVSKNDHCVFLLLGNFAKSKDKFIIDPVSKKKNEHRIVRGVHPSPYSARNGFFHSGIFKDVESKLGSQINWNV